MACVLGDRVCMESLRKDLTDLQGTVIDVFSRVGAVRHHSWKFPDKVSCDLDLVQLLERYDHVEGDPEYTQLSHVVLLELVIDRLLLLLQSFTAYTELLMSKGGFPQTRGVGPSMSIGLTVRKYWNSMGKLGASYQQMMSFSSVKSDAVVGKTAREISSSRALSSSSQTQSSSVAPFVTEPQLYVARDIRTIGSQTLESALVPCDACAIAQNSLKEVSNAIINVCNNQNLPCALTKARELLPSGAILSTSEMRYWASEESKDLARISKHLSELTQIINPLKEQLETERVENERLQKNMDTYKKQILSEREQQQRQTKESERRLQEKGQQSQEMVNKLEKDKEELKRGRAVLEERVSILKKELDAQHSTIQDLELSRKQLVFEMRSMVDKEEALVLEQKVRKLKDQLEIINSRLKESEEAVCKERARGESLRNHEESLQTKQRSLLQLLDRLSQECESLRDSLGDAEEERAKLEEQIEAIEGEKVSLRRQLEAKQNVVVQLQKEKQSLEESISGMNRTLTVLQESLQERQDREKLLVCYPELHPAPEFESSGDITEDMEKQLQANSIRISILEEENARLRASLSKLKEKSQEGSLRMVPKTQLWTLSHTPEQAALDPEHLHISTKPPTPSMAANRGPPPRSASGHRDRRLASATKQQNLSYTNISAENVPPLAYTRVKPERGRNRTPSSDRR